MATLTLKDIPTIADDYKSGKLQPSSGSSEGGDGPNPSASINSKVSTVKASITTLDVTAIVNAANNSLRGGGGVDGAIHRSAGPSLLQACIPLNGCATGSAKITLGFRLPAKHVIHAVGPVYDSSEKEACERSLRGCYRESLELVGGVAATEGRRQDERTVEEEGDGGDGREGEGVSIAFSCISTGVYGYPSRDAAHVACRVVREWLDQEKMEGERKRIERVVFCLFEEKDVVAYREVLPIYFPPPEAEVPKTTGSSDPATKAQDNAAPSSVDDMDDWEKVEKPTSIPSGSPDQAGEVQSAKASGGGISEGTQENPGGVDSHAQNQLMKDW